MDQLELVFWLLVRLQFMYFQYNMYLHVSIVVHTNIVYIYIYIYIYIYTHTHTHTHVIQNNLRTPQLAGFARQLGCKKTKIKPHENYPLYGIQDLIGIHNLVTTPFAVSQLMLWIGFTMVMDRNMHNYC